MKTGKQFCYIDLFAGCGGLSLGLHNANWKGLFAVEKSEDAFKTLKYNLIDKKNHFDWPDWLEVSSHNIETLIKEHETALKKLRGKVDMVAGGPPCQGFSTAGRREENDERNDLANSYLEFVGIVKPKILLFENVKTFGVGFKKGSKERGRAYSEIVLEKLEKIGYKNPAHRVIDFSGFGVPQTRKRFIILATLEGNPGDFFKLLEEEKESFLGKKGIEPLITLADAISDIEEKNGVIDSPDSNNFKAGIYNGKVLTPYQKLMRKNCDLEIPDSHRFVNHRGRVIGKFWDIIENDLSNDEIQEKYGTKKTSTSLLMADRPSLTLTTLPDDFVHYSEPRVPTVREYARIQSFPDWFEFKGAYTTGTKKRRNAVPRYSQAANAIPPLFAELCGIVLKKLL
ncbi:MAG: DNA cytosine methyltransferase [Candidatus Aminicenantes bacterium]|nr:DNA cytosine methyltransferase [Candidatus Aminicenantes bacterium]